MRDQALYAQFVMRALNLKKVLMNQTIKILVRLPYIFRTASVILECLLIKKLKNQKVKRILGEKMLDIYPIHVH